MLRGRNHIKTSSKVCPQEMHWRWNDQSPLSFIIAVSPPPPILYPTWSAASSNLVEWQTWFGWGWSCVVSGHLHHAKLALSPVYHVSYKLMPTAGRPKFCTQSWKVCGRKLGWFRPGVHDRHTSSVVIVLSDTWEIRIPS